MNKRLNLNLLTLNTCQSQSGHMYTDLRNLKNMPIVNLFAGDFEHNKLPKLSCTIF